MANFDLVGKLRLRIDQADLAFAQHQLEKALNRKVEILSAREVRAAEKEIQNLARTVNRDLTRAFDNVGKKASKVLKESLAFRDRIKSGDARSANKTITRDFDNDNKARIKSLRQNIIERDRQRREQESIDAQEVAQSQAAFKRREAIAKQEVAARVAARAALAKEDEAEIRASQQAFQRRERIAKQAVVARVRQDEQELKAGQKAFERRERIARESVAARAKSRAGVGGGGRPPTTLENDPAFNFGKQSALAFKRFAAFSLAAGSLYLVVDAFRDAIKEAVSFEAELVKLAQVSNSSVAALKGTRTEIDRLATSLGTSSKDLVESAVTIRQAGFSLEETNAALETLALTTLSPSFNDLKNTTEGLIALKSQFGTAAEDFKRQFGEINAVSKAFAVESEDIVTAIRKSGGAFKVAGGNVTELIALFTAVRSTTRESADTIATGFRTIFARLQRPQIIDELKAFNIELRDAEGNFVGPLKAIEEINKALSEVGQSGDLQFARVAEQIGGIRQISKVIPLIQQFTTAQRAANVARLGANSLDEDAAIAQTSLANRLTKTREKFLEFARELTINQQFKDLSNGILGLADSLTSLAKTIAPILPTLGLAFGIANIGTAVRFGQGFSSKISGQKNFFNQRGFADATAGALPFLSRRNRLRLGANLPLAGAIGGVGISVLGSSLADTSPINNRSRFLTGRTLERAGGGITGGFIGGAALGSAIPGVGTLIGAGIGAALGAAQQGLSGFTEALQEAQDVLEESKFRPAFDALTETLSEISAGRLSPFGRRDTLNAGLQALRDRRLNATGVEREELRGNIRQTVESLLLFQQQLLDSAKTLEQFTAAGGDDAIKFISENSVLTARELEKQRDAAFKNREREDNLFKRLLSSQERLLQQSNLITAFGAALENATIKANDAAERFSFLASGAFGQNIGVRFRGTRGFGANSTDLALRGTSNNQIASLIGVPEIRDLAQQSVAIADIRNQLPAILAEFGTKRPIGATTDDLDIFVRDRLEAITKDIPNRDLTVQPIIDAVFDSLSSELATQGRGQNEAIQKILSAPAQFIEGIFSNAELTAPLEKLFKDAATALKDRVNVFAEQISQITANELAIRKSVAETLQRQFEITTQIAQRRNPLRFPLAELQAGRNARARALLGGNAGAIGGNASNIVPFIRNAQQIVNQRELDLQNAKSIDEQKSLIKVIVELQGQIAAAGDAFELLVDNSDKIAAKFDEFDKIQLGRDQIKGGIKEFTFGGRDARNQLNLASAAASLVSANPNLFFDPTVIPDALQPVIGDFLDRFADARVFNGRTGKELSDQIQATGLRNAGFPPDLIKEFLSNDPNRRQEELLKQAEELAREESLKRQDFLRLQSENNKALNTDIRDSLNDFIADLRTNLLKDVATSTQTRLGAVGAQRAELQKQADQFALIQSLGGSDLNVDNKRVLDLAREDRRNAGKRRNAAFLLSDARAFLEPGSGGASIGELNKRFARNPAFSELLRTTVPGDSVKSFSQLKKFQQRTIDIASAVGIAERTFDTLAPDLELNKSQRQGLRDKISANIAEGGNLSGQINIVRFKDIVSNILIEAAEQSQKNSVARGGKFSDAFQTLSEQQIKFFENIVNLPGDKFNELSTAINKLGDGARLDKVTEQLNKLNAESQALSLTLEGLNGQIKAINGNRAGGVAPAPAGGGGGFFNFGPELQSVFQGITQGLSSFISSSPQLSQALNNFPRNIEMAGNHKVEVTINGAQALSNMQPVIEEFVKSEIAKALTKFTLDTLPGALSYSQ